MRVAAANGVTLAARVKQPEPVSVAVEDLLKSSSTDELYTWAQRYEHGESVTQDYAGAVRLYCAAAEQGSVGAQHALGWMYANGRGVARDDGLAGAWFGRAAEAGDAVSKRVLSRLGLAGNTAAARCILPDGQAWSPIPPSVPNPDQPTIERWVTHFAPRFGLDSSLVLAIIHAESNFDASARSHKNAQGLMQLIPATAKRFGVSDAFDPIENIQGGMAYLRWLLTHFNGNLEFALAGYNAGERAVERYAGIPPYPETRAYVKRVLASLRRKG